MIFSLAQETVATAALDWKHALLAVLIPLVAGAAYKIGTRAVEAVESRLRAAGHPQAADAFDLLVAGFRSSATPAEKRALAESAKDAGVDHPAITEATK